MNHHQQNKNERSSKTLSTWALSLVMMGMCAGRLMAADVPPPVKVEAVKEAIVSDNFVPSDGQPEAPFFVRHKDGVWKFVVVRGVQQLDKGDYKGDGGKTWWYSCDFIEVTAPKHSDFYRNAGRNDRDFYKPLRGIDRRSHDDRDDSAVVRRQINTRKHKVGTGSFSADQESRIDAGINYMEEGAKASFMNFFVNYFLEISLDFKGGKEDILLAEAARALEDAYSRQMPKTLKGILADQLYIKVIENVDQPRMSAFKCAESSLHEVGVNYLNKGRDGNNSLFNCNYDEGLKPLDNKSGDSLLLRSNVVSSGAKVTEFFNIGDIPRMPLTDKSVSVSDVAALFELSWTMSANVVSAGTKYHQETGMLIVTGSENEIKIAKNAFSKLCNIPAASRPRNNTANKLDPLGDTLSDESLKEATEKEGKEGKESKEDKTSKEKTRP
jgi:hypothetical protein